MATQKCKFQLLSLLIIGGIINIPSTFSQTTLAPGNSFTTFSPELPFLECTRPDQSPGIRCPTTQLCVFEFARCDYVDDCGNGEDEAGCVDGEVCSFKRPFVDQIMNSCPLSTQIVIAMPDESVGQLRSWDFTEDSVFDGGFIREVTFDHSFYGTGLYRLNFSSEINILFFSSEQEGGFPMQTKPLEAVFAYFPFQIITLEKYFGGTFIQQDVGDMLNITLVARDCDVDNITACTTAIETAVMISDCPYDLGEQIYAAAFDGNCPTLQDEFLPCTRPDQSPGIRCPTTELCISEFAPCNYVDDCGNGEDEAGCMDGEVCSFKRPFVDQIMNSCPLSTQIVIAMPDESVGQLRSWDFTEDSVFDGGFIREVTFDHSFYGTGLYRLNFSSEINVLFFSSEQEGGFPIQTKPLEAVFAYFPFQIITLEKYFGGTFIQQGVGDMLNITLVARDCDVDNTTACTTAIETAVMIGDCPYDLGEQIYEAAFDGNCPTLQDEFLPCTRPDQSRGIRCPTTELCISEFAPCNYVDDCGNGEDEAGCMDGEVCSFKRPFVDQIINSCPLSTRRVIGMPDNFESQFSSWQFTEDSVSEGEYVREVTFDHTFYGTGLYRLNFSSDINILFFSSEQEGGFQIQTKPLEAVSAYFPFQIVTLEKYLGGTFIQQDVGDMLNITLVSRDCDVDNIMACTSAIETAVVIDDCPSDLGEQIYAATFAGNCPNEFLPCTRSDQSPGIRCPTTQLCISEFARCDYVDDCGNGQDEAGCVDNDVCSYKRGFVDQILTSCPLRSRTVIALPGQPEGQFVSWNVTRNSSSQDFQEEFITEVTFDFFFYGTGLYRINFTTFEDDSVVFFRSEGEETSPVQTKSLPYPLPFTTYDMVTLEQYTGQGFVQQNVGDDLNIRVVSGDCEAASQECLIAVQRASMIYDCPSNLGETVYSNVYNPEVCPLRPNCAANEYACQNGICISNDYVCDSFNDCGDFTDEINEFACEVNDCTVEVNFNDDSRPPSNQQCLEDTSVFSDQQTTSKVTFVLTDFEKVFLTQMEFNNIFFFGVCRVNVTTPSGTSVVYQESFSQGFAPTFRTPLVTQRDTVTITLECTENPLLYPWHQQNISVIDVRGVPINSSCEESRGCIAFLSSSLDYPEHCFQAQATRAIFDELQHCFEPPRITFISPNASVTAGTPQTLVCLAEGLPTPTIEWIHNGETLEQFTSDGTSYLSVVLFDDREVTCRATSDGMSVEKKIIISQLSMECEQKLDEAMLFHSFGCLNVGSFSGVSFQSFDVEIPLFGGGLAVNVSIAPGYLTAVSVSPIISFELQIRFKPFCAQPTKRDFGNLVYSRLYRNIVITEGQRVDLNLEPPVLVPASENCVELRFWIQSQMGRIENEIPPLSAQIGVISPCGVDDEQGFNDMGSPFFCDLNEWSRFVNDKCFENRFVPQLTRSKVFLAAVERCNGITVDEPTITRDPLPFLAVSQQLSSHTQCQAEHFLEIEWFKKEWYGNEATNVTGNVLSFMDFSGNDQGLYYCVARGGSQYSNMTAVSQPVIVVDPEIPTYLATIKFNYRNFSQNLTDPQSEDYRLTSGDIESFFNIGLSDVASGFAVKELRPGSIVADVLVFLQQGYSIEEAKSSLSPNNSIALEEFGFLQPDLSSLSFESVSFCEMEVLNDTLAGRLTFPDVSIGQTASSVELCPVYSSMAGEPRASRACSGDFVAASQWEEPVINNCFEGETDDSGLNNLMTHLDSNPVTDDNVTEVSRDLADATEMTNLTSNDLVSVAELLELITGVQSPSPEVTSNVIETVDNVLDLEDNDYEDSIPKEEAPSRILQSLENQLTNLHDGGDAVNFTDVRAFVGAVARSFDRDDFSSGVSFGNFFTNNARNIRENLNESDTQVLKGNVGSLADNVKAVITLPYSIVSDIQTGPNGTIPLTFIIHRTSHLFMSSSTQEGAEEAVESLIISATIEGKTIDNLVDPVVSKYYQKTVEGAKEESRRCVFWDFSLADGFGDWSDEGCMLVSGPEDGEESLIECQCTHLTNFAVLVDIQGDIDNLVLDILSIIGCVVSIIALLITIVTFLVVKKLREKRPQQILINLCFALLGLYLCFVIGIDRSNLPVGCVIFGALIHYFCLASVAWMCVEATNMYLLFVRVFDTGISGFMWKACLAAWGLPLVVVVVSVIVKSSNYTSTYCFPQAETLTFYLGVLLLIALMLCYNLVIFILVIRQLTCGRKAMGQDQDKRKEMYRRAQNAIAISVLLGLTWAFGFLSIGGAQFIFNLLFLIFNSLQGLFVFIFFCLRQKEIRTIWWGWLSCRGDKDDKYLGSKSKVVTSQGSQPTSKDSSTLVKSDKQTDSTNANSESIQMIEKEESSTMNSNGENQ